MMTLKSPEFFATEFLPTLNRVTSFAQTARLLNFDESTPHVWVRESKAAAKRGDDPSDFLFEYDGSRRYLHQHIKSIGRACITDIEANARSRARDGYWRPCRFQGKTVWREDPKLIGLSDAVLNMLGYDDRLLRVNGELQPELEWIAPSTDLVVAILQANSETYRKRSSIDMNVSARIGGSAVLTMGGPRAPQIAAPLPVLEIVQEAEEPERVLSDDADDVDLSVTDTDPDAPPVAPVDDDEPVNDEQPAPAPEPVDPGPMIREPTPSIYDPRPGPNPLVVKGGNRSLTAEEKAVLSRLPSSLNRR
jgi:hypothetical protein